MPIDRGMDKDDMVHIYNGILYSHKNEIMSFATWMDPEIIILSKVNQTVKDKHHMISLTGRILKKKDTNELICRTKTESEFAKHMVTKENMWGGEGWTRGLELAYAPWGIWNDWPVRICCIAQGTLSNIL